MPFTPFHMGPALLFKAATGRYFSVLVFGLAQVAMDIEPLVGMLNDRDVLHGWSHTWLGATLIGLAVAAGAPPLARWILSDWNRYLAARGMPWLASPPEVGRVAAASGALLGTWSHVLMDATMHADMRPLAPWSASNGLLDALPSAELHLFCVGTGIAGLLSWWLAGMARRRRDVALAQSPVAPLHWRTVLAARPASFFQRQTWQYALGGLLVLLARTAASSLAGHGVEGSAGDVAAAVFLLGSFSLLGAALYSLGTARAGVATLAPGMLPFLAGAVMTASWVALAWWLDALPLAPGIEGVKSEYSRRALGVAWTFAGPFLAGMSCAWHCRWRIGRGLASGSGPR